MTQKTKKTSVVIIGTNAKKQVEFNRIFGKYGVTPSFVLPNVNLDDQAHALLSGDATLILIEKSNLYHAKSDDVIAEYTHLTLARNISTCQYWIEVDGEVQHHTITKEIKGYLNIPTVSRPGAFAWDSIFVPMNSSISYDGALVVGLKNSARDLTISEVISATMLFDCINLNFQNIDMVRLVDFNQMPAEMLSGIAVLQTPEFKTSPVNSIMTAALRDGAFFRTAQSRRERNYWLPGLNGGIPLVPKKDPIHELTYMMHDFMHGAMPDLIYNGHTDISHRKIYMIHRMISEAISLVAADYAFVDLLKKQGVEYDFDKRSIHPFFASMTVPDGVDALYQLCRANTMYVLTGDDSAFLAMNPNMDTLRAYKQKYDRFFVEDYNWTDANFRNMTQSSHLFARWTTKMTPALEQVSTPLLTDFTDTICQKLNIRPADVDSYPVNDLIMAVFHECWTTKIQAALNNNTDLNHHSILSNSFKRYMIGQSIMYERYAHVVNIKAVGDTIIDLLNDNIMFDHIMINKVRDLHDAAVDQLLELKLITSDDARVFKEIVPMFDPTFVYYDRNANTKNLIATAKAMLGS